MWNRRHFLQSAVVASSALALRGFPGARLLAEDKPGVAPFGDPVVFSGTPHERGRAYGRHFANAIRGFLDREIYDVFVGHPNSKEELMSYAAGCKTVIREACPIIAQELEGMAEGSGLSLDEHVLITLHEELYHRSTLPLVPHCTAVGVSPPVTSGQTLIGQTWDWMQSVAGMSTMLEWSRDDGPSVLAYAFPGLWIGAGINSAGLALCWTSAGPNGKLHMPRVGLPSYVLLSHLLYQTSLDEVQRVAKQNRHAGWFTFVMGDAEGRLLNVEGSPEGITCEESKGQLIRVGFGTRERTSTTANESPPLHPRCKLVEQRLATQQGKFDLTSLQATFSTPEAGICVGKNTIDLMVFDTAKRKAFLSRGSDYGVSWREYAFTKTR